MNSVIRLLILLTIAVGISRSGYAQKITAGDVELQPKNLFAAKNARIDDKGKPCAVLLIQSTIPNLVFSGEIVGDVDKRQSTYFIYLKSTAKKLKVKTESGYEIRIKLDNLAPKHTYEVVIQEKIDFGGIILYSDPSGASVKLISDDNELDLGRTPLKGEQKIAEGNYVLELSKPGYRSITKHLTVKPNRITKLGTIKLKRQH